MRNQEINNLEATISDYLEKIKALEKDVNMKNAQINQLQTDTGSQKTQVEQLQTQLSALKSQGNVSDMQEKLNMKGVEIKTIQSLYDEKSAALMALQASFKELQAKESANTLLIDKLKQEVNGLQSTPAVSVEPSSSVNQAPANNYKSMYDDLLVLFDQQKLELKEWREKFTNTESAQVNTLFNLNHQIKLQQAEISELKQQLADKTSMIATMNNSSSNAEQKDNGIITLLQVIYLLCICANVSSFVIYYL